MIKGDINKYIRYIKISKVGNIMDGWVYCFSNDYMPGIVKIGRTKELPEKRLKDANSCTWNLPFKLIISKKVNNYKQKEKYLHKVFKSYRIKNNREFFHLSYEQVIDQFNLMDGIQMLGGSETEKKQCNKIKTNNIQPQDTTSDTKQPNTTPDEPDQITNNMNSHEISNEGIKNCNHLTKLKDGQRIRHNNKLDSIWYGIYNSKNNSIICSVDGCNEYKGISPLNRFVADNYKKTRPERTFAANAWAECEYEISENDWKSINNLRI